MCKTRHKHAHTHTHTLTRTVEDKTTDDCTRVRRINWRRPKRNIVKKENVYVRMLANNCFLPHNEFQMLLLNLLLLLFRMSSNGWFWHSKKKNARASPFGKEQRRNEKILNVNHKHWRTSSTRNQMKKHLCRARENVISFVCCCVHMAHTNDCDKTSRKSNCISYTLASVSVDVVRNVICVWHSANERTNDLFPPFISLLPSFVVDSSMVFFSACQNRKQQVCKCFFPLKTFKIRQKVLLALT